MRLGRNVVVKINPTSPIQRIICQLVGRCLTEEQLALPDRHPELGPVTLRQLLAAWAVHDLGHLAQISRVMAKRYTEEVGAWGEYLSILRR